ncbi:MAG: glycosyltransferase family 4 protein [Acidobacteria bacterium]|nr:glycosyltransferase family 4 protein [Acidobacteriota bacterium]
MPARILLDARHVRDFGFGTYIRNLLRGFVANKAPHEFLLASYKADQHEFDGLPANYRRVEYERKDDGLLNEFVFPAFVRKWRPDLTHIPLARVPALTPRPYVVTVHDLSSLIIDAGPGWRGEMRQVYLRRGLMRAECVMAVSESTRHDVVSLMGMPPSRVRRIYGAVDPRFTHQAPGLGARAAGPAAWEHERTRVLERYQVNYPFLLYSGTIRPQKNIPRLVEAFAFVRSELQHDERWKDLRLLIIGDEISRFPAVRQTVIHSRVEQYVRFLGFVPLDTLRVFYGAASAFVFPSLYEGFGMPPLEAMASGTPVVCSNTTSLPEVVGDAAEIVSPDNVFDIARGIKEVLLNEERRKQLISLGHERCLHFRWEETAREVLEVYDSLLTHK